MKTLKSYKCSILIKSLIPSLIGFASLAIERTIRTRVLNPQRVESNDFHHEDVFISENRSIWLLKLVYEASRNLGNTIFEAYDSYFTFILMMLVLNVILYGSDIIQWLFTKRNKQAKVSFMDSWRGFFLVNHEHLKQFLRSLLGYSLIFCFYQIIWIYIGSSISMQTLHQMTFNNVQDLATETAIIPTRVLEEKEISSFPLSNQKPSLSIGKVLGQLDVYAVSIQLSKDGNTAFVTTNSPSTLKIIDVSDPEYPVILSSSNLPTNAFYLIFKTLLVSPDETKLYMSNVETLQIFDITHFKSPFLIATVEDKAALIPTQNEKIYGIIKPNLLLSRDNKFLFVSGYGLQIFDISIPTAPALIRSLRSRINSGTLASASIALSADKKILYYSDSSLWIYDIEDPRNMRVLNSFNTTNPISSMIISDDGKTAFVIGLDRKNEIFLLNLDISDIISIKEGQMTKLNQTATCQPIFLERTPKNLFLMIVFMDEIAGIWHKMYVYDTTEQRLITHKKLLVKDSLFVLFTEDYKKVLMGNAGKFEIADLYPEYPNKHAFTNDSNIIQSFNTTTGFKFFSSNEDILYMISTDATFGIHKVGINGQLTNLSVSKTEEEVRNLVISKDYKRAFWIYQNRMQIVDISNPENITVLEDYIIQVERGQPMISSLILSHNSKIAYLTFASFGVNYLEIIDFSDRTKTLRMDLGRLTQYMTPFLSNDERTLFLVSRNLMIFNVSDPYRPILLKTFSFLVEEEEYKTTKPIIAASLSPDGKTLLIKDESSLMNYMIQVIDVSNPNSPYIRSEFHFPLQFIDPVYAEKSMLFSADSQTVYFLRPEAIMVVDIANSISLKYLGSIQILNKNTDDRLRDFSISQDGRKAYVLTKTGTLHLVGINPLYSTFLKQDTLMLGERYNIDLLVLEMNEFLDYNRIGAEYRFTKFTLVEARSIQNIDFEEVVLKMAPSWMNFDLKGQTLTVEARRKNDIGTYRAYFGFSTQLPRNIFLTKLSNESLSKTEGPIKPQDIFATLIALAYVDNQLFLTENFGDYDDFILPSQYDSIRYEIYEILKKYSFGTFNELRIVESLGVSWNEDKLKIKTASVTNLKVEVSLSGEHNQFLHKYYGSLLPLITNNKSHLVLEGSLKDVNLALKEVVINLPKNIETCDGEIIIDDKLNPIRTESVRSISRLFNHNQPPELNRNFSLTIQNQVNKESVLTGQYFQIKLNPYTFFDQYTEVENLNYQLVFIKNNNETTILPSWLSFSDLTLMGTAPEEIFERNFEFKLIVKNEFQELKIPLKLHVSISSSFVIKLLIKYSPYVLSIVGLLISANKIFNVVFKWAYKHPKDFYVKIGEEITPEVIFPIGFIREEIQEARRMLKLLEKKSEANNKKQLLSSFMKHEEMKLDKFKIIETIKDSLNQLSFEEKKNFDLYLGGSHPQRLINQIIINTLTNEMLKEDKETKKCFEKVKKDWPEFIEWNLINSSFKVNDEKLKVCLRKHGDEGTTLRNDDDGESLLSSSTSSLLEKSKYNLDLLKESILAYAFDCQNIDVLPVSVEFHVKEKIKTNFWKKLLKLDLKDCPFREKGKIGYGIEYFKEYQTLYFHGIVRPDIRNKTLVVQITNLQHKILKEIWIFENSNYEGVGSDKREIEAQGKEYEVF